jgi:hypothetical protein
VINLKSCSGGGDRLPIYQEYVKIVFHRAANTWDGHWLLRFVIEIPARIEFTNKLTILEYTNNCSSHIATIWGIEVG